MKTLDEIIRKSKRIVFFGGAGVSTESGIPDFRSVDGLYHMKYEFPPEEILSHHFFVKNTEEFYRFYKEKMICTWAKPNAAHLALAKLEQEGKLAAVVTQNIDGLHQMAGSQNVLELHGSTFRNRCMKCGRTFGIEAIVQSEGVPYCECGGIIKPDVVLYEESLDEVIMMEAINQICKADTLIIGGTSLSVYPAAGLIRYFEGNELVLINRDVTSADRNATLCIREPIGQVLSAFL